MAIAINDGVLVLENEWLRRRIRLAPSPHTSDFVVRPAGRTGADVWVPVLWPGTVIPLEAAVTIGGQEFAIGTLAKAPGQSSGDDAPGFRAASWAVQETALGWRLDLTCEPASDAVPPLTLVLHYELARDLPLLIKSLTVRNRGPVPVVLEQVTVEMLHWERLDKELCWFTDYYDVYGKSRRRDPVFQGFTRREFPQPIMYTLAPGTEWTSFRCFVYVTPNEPEASGVTKARILQRLAPWTTTNPVSQEIDSASSFADLCQAANEAAANGIEMCHLFANQLFTTTGDYVPRPDLFPRGDDDLRRLVAHYHQCGVRVVPYVSLTIAWQAFCGAKAAQVCLDHDDWQYRGPSGIRYNCWGWGNMCYQSGWGDYITGKLEHLLDLGFDGLHIDGPYHGLPCDDPSHRHQHPSSTPMMNWDFERRLFARWRARGVFFTVPQDPAALLFGANAIPGGYTESDHAAMGGLPLVTATRQRLYDDRYRLPGTCGWAYHALESLHKYGIEASEDAPASYEHSLAGGFGYGHWGLLRGRRLYLGPRTEAIYRRWRAHFEHYRATLSGQFIHLVRPDGHHPDAALLVNAAADPPAVLIAFNPSPAPARLALRLPLALAGCAPDTAISVPDLGSFTLDSSGAAGVTVALAPWEVRAWPILRS